MERVASLTHSLLVDESVDATLSPPVWCSFAFLLLLVSSLPLFAFLCSSNLWVRFLLLLACSLLVLLYSFGLVSLYGRLVYGFGVIEFMVLCGLMELAEFITSKNPVTAPLTVTGFLLWGY